MVRSGISWQQPPHTLMLSPRQVHIWSAELDQFTADRSALYSLLSPDEQARAARFHFEQDRHRFIAGRGLLRTLLSRYLAIPPPQIQFNYGPQGKPELKGLPPAAPQVTFNLSHSQGFALYAVTCDRPIGIDVEQIRPTEVLQLAQRFFARREYDAIAALEPPQQQRAFFQYWTCKEAYLKAIGAGLGGLSDVEIAWGGDRSVTLVSPPVPAPGGLHWVLEQLHPDPNFAAALAVAGPLEQVSCFDYKP